MKMAGKSGRRENENGEEKKHQAAEKIMQIKASNGIE